ncbi:hypothetical protein [Novipirellula artificiosorum]|uniref:Uncharacterized protein n=1 Tax=Novipirellula artificiosorum TaxID=2528016 RepID=A0A5C6DE00_9BACT|nr:hypothetical protein [Novipirellula artificiosorum]TWU34878.1 hypothetical protein Poly41_40210 [Novipirellula artificiosorum]
MQDDTQPDRKPPYATLGAGDLISPVSRDEGYECRFSVQRRVPGHGRTLTLRQEDLQAFAKLCHALALTLADAEWMDSEGRKVMGNYAESLDHVVPPGSEVDNGS